MRPQERHFPSREDLLLASSAVALGLAGAALFAVYRAVSLSNEDVGGRLTEFGSNLAWPGILILLGVAAVVWFGWKANLD